MIIGITSGLILMLTHVILLRILKNGFAKAMVFSWVGSLVFTIACAVVFCLNSKELLTALVTNIAVFLFYLEFFSMICRGFSFHIIKLVHERQPITVSELMVQYGNGMGPTGLLKKRIEGMAASGLLTMNQNRLRADFTRSKAIVFLSRSYKTMLRMGAGG